MIQKIKNILQRRTVVILFAVILIAQSILDIYEDFFNMAHQHILIIMGILMIINELRYFYLGSHSLLEQSKNEEVEAFFQSSDQVLKKRIVDFAIGIIIVITSCYGVFLDIEEMYAQTVGVIIGCIMSLFALRHVFLGLRKMINFFKS